VKNIIIIGATSGIAQAIARQLAARGGTRLMLWGRNRPKLDIVAADLRIWRDAAVEVDAFDFNDFSTYPAALDRARMKGEWDTAIICHGSLGDQAACEKDFRMAEQELHANFLSPVVFLTILANYFEGQGRGALAVISSVAGDRGRQSNYVYGTGKAGLDAFLSGLRNRLFPKNVHVLTIKPGFVDTPMTAHLKKGALFASADKVAADILHGIERKKCVIYTPWFWRWIMLIIRSIPEGIFRKLKL